MRSKAVTKSFPLQFGHRESTLSFIDLGINFHFLSSSTSSSLLSLLLFHWHGFIFSMTVLVDFLWLQCAYLSGNRSNCYLLPSVSVFVFDGWLDDWDVLWQELGQTSTTSTPVPSSSLSISSSKTNTNTDVGKSNTTIVTIRWLRHVMTRVGTNFHKRPQLARLSHYRRQR